MGKLICIEVENFKSYNGQQTIGPFHQFTSIIGPNGTGKSNLMDAISFVLGIHSSHLRSQNLKDMIYRSETLHHDVLQSSQTPKEAHVTAVYENSQGRQIRFMRRIDQNGHSEYRIDGQTIQYTQYNTALEKENIFVKAKNFLVFQGDVEHIASQNPKDLTTLIENISGSWDYRNRYDELKQLMEETIENNTHCFNIKRSVTSEIKQYEEQKAEAEKFEQLIADKCNLIIQYLLWKLFHLEVKLNTLHEECALKNTNKNDLQYEITEMEKKFIKSREEKALIHREKIKYELNIRKYKRELENQLPICVSYKEKISSLEMRIKQIERNISRIQRDEQQQENIVKTLENSLNLLIQDEDRFNESILISRITNGPILTKEQMIEYQKRKQIVSQNAMEEQQLLQQYQRQLKTQEQYLDDKKSKIDRLREEESKALEALHQLKEENNTIYLEIENITDKLNVRQNELRQFENERKSIHKREIQLNDKIQATLNKLMQLSITQQESNKEVKFNKSLTILKQIYPNVYGKLSDLCRPNQRKYDTAVSTILGRYLNAIVVEDEQTAFDCIQYMREHQIGTATFLPRSSLLVSPINDRYQDLMTGARLALDVLTFDKQYENVVQYACGNTLICNDLNIAKEICFHMNENVKAVTLDGSIIHQSGLITGGYSTIINIQRWQQNDIEELIRCKDMYLNELNCISKNKRMGSAENAAKNDCFNLTSQQRILNEELITISRKIEGIEGTFQDIRRKLHDAMIPYEQSKMALNQLKVNMKNVEERISQIEDYVFEDFCAEINVLNIREYEALQCGASDETIEHQSQYKLQKSRINSQLSFERGQLNELIERLNKMKSSLSNDIDEKSKLEIESNGMTGISESLSSKLQLYHTELEKQTRLEENKQIEITEIIHVLEAMGKNAEEFLREYRAVESESNKIRAERVAIFRKSKLEGIKLPLIRGSLDDVIILEETTPINNTNMDIDTTSDSDNLSADDNIAEYNKHDDINLETSISQLSIQSTDWEIQVDFSQLGEHQRADDSQVINNQFQEKIKQISDEIEQMAPNLKAIDRLEGVNERFKVAEQEYNTTRAAAKLAKEQFNIVKQKRYSLFNDAFSYISEKIDIVYKDLTKGHTFPLGGSAYLSAENSEEPYLEGIKYHAMPPMKRFRDMEQLSGGEKSVAALALLFAIHSYKPSPFFVLDEVDAALDNTNVSAVANYIREHAAPDFQFIVISLKHNLYEKAQSLVGIYRDQDINSSKTVTLMLEENQN